MDSVGLALQCCLGGEPSGFRVKKLSDRRFRFSVASNHVGHFIHHLESRIWPDFHCHFRLFRGDAFSNAFAEDEQQFELNGDGNHFGWSQSMNRHNHLPAHRRVPESLINQASDQHTVAVRTNLDFLRQSSEREKHASGDAHQFQFGSFVSVDSLNNSAKNQISQADSMQIKFGSFDSVDISPYVELKFPCIPSMPDLSSDLVIMSNIFSLASAPSLENLREMRNCRYSDEEIIDTFGFPFMPDIGAAQSECPVCLGPGSYCKLTSNTCAIGLRCRLCWSTGHVRRVCPKSQEYAARWKAFKDSAWDSLTHTFQGKNDPVPKIMCNSEASKGNDNQQHLDPAPSSRFGKYQYFPKVCSKCLEVGHSRNCRKPVRCRKCREPGHISAKCPSRFIWKVKSKTVSTANFSASKVWKPKPQSECVIASLPSQAHGVFSVHAEVMAPDDAVAPIVDDVSAAEDVVAPFAAAQVVEPASVLFVTQTRVVAVSTQVVSPDGLCQFFGASFMFGQTNFLYMILFFNEYIYSGRKCLPGVDPAPMKEGDIVVDLHFFWLVLSFGLKSSVLKAVLTRDSMLDYAEYICALRVIYPYKRVWAVAFAGFYLDHKGELVYVSNMTVAAPLPVEAMLLDVGMGIDELGLVTEVVPVPALVESESSLLNESSLPVDTPSVVTATSSLRGRTHKAASPTVVTQVRRSTRNIKDGFKGQVLPNFAPHRKVSKVPKADAPAVLQIREMQRLGVEKCQIDPDDLTEEKLLQGRPE